MGKLTPSSVIDIMIVALLAGILLPIGIEQVAQTNTSNFSAPAQTVWNNLDTLLVVAIMLGVVEFFRRR